MDESIAIGDVVLNPRYHRAQVCDTRIKLGEKQWIFLYSLGLCAGTLVTRDFLLATLHPDPKERPDPRSIDMIACTVRKKLAAASGGKNYIKAVAGHGSGYMLCAPA